MSSQLFDVITPNVSLNFMNSVKNSRIKNHLIKGIYDRLIDIKSYESLKPGVVGNLMNKHHFARYYTYFKTKTFYRSLYQRF